MVKLETMSVLLVVSRWPISLIERELNSKCERIDKCLMSMAMNYISSYQQKDQSAPNCVQGLSYVVPLQKRT